MTLSGSRSTRKRGGTDIDFRNEVRSVLDAELPAGWAGYGALSEPERRAFDDRWRPLLRDRGWFAPGWPADHGGSGLDVRDQAVLFEEFRLRGVPLHAHPNDSFGINLLGPTLLHWGTDDQRRRFLPATLSGRIRWAQGFSEPEAGSDLFNVRTRAVRQGDGWVVDGSKIWQTAGLTANWIFALVRTNETSRRGRGLSFVLIDLEQPGVDVRGIRNLAGETEFAEVFFDGARAADADLVGGIDSGAQVALTLLGFERGAGGLAKAVSARVELRRVAELARTYGMDHDPAVRQRLGRCLARVHVSYCLGLRAVEASAAGTPPGPESSVAKLLNAEYRQTVTELAMDLLGRDAMVREGDAAIDMLEAQPLGLDPSSARAWIEDFLHARPGTVYGGSSEIQRNTIAEHVLGLPREPRATAPADDR